MLELAPSKKPHGIGGISHDGRDNGLEFYSTPPKATEALLNVCCCGPIIWEPACGAGAISEVLIQSGRKVISTELEERGYGMSGIDFLQFPTLLAPEIITNPPFSLATKFIEHAFELEADRIILLLKLTFLEGQARKSMLEQHLSKVYVFSKRLTLWKNDKPKEKSGGMMAYGWMVFDKVKIGSTTVQWI
jgi:hypothetical protein